MDTDNRRHALNDLLRKPGLFDGGDRLSTPPCWTRKPGSCGRTSCRPSTAGGTGDKLHPNRAGYLAMGNAVDLPHPGARRSGGAAASAARGPGQQPPRLPAMPGPPRSERLRRICRAHRDPRRHRLAASGARAWQRRWTCRSRKAVLPAVVALDAVRRLGAGQGRSGRTATRSEAASCPRYTTCRAGCGPAGDCEFLATRSGWARRWTRTSTILSVTEKSGGSGRLVFVSRCGTRSAAPAGPAIDGGAGHRLPRRGGRSGEAGRTRPAGGRRRRPARCCRIRCCCSATRR